jgi:acyl carrier protein
MTQQEVEEIIKKEIHIILGGKTEVRPDEELHNLGMDSMSFVEILVFIEKRFGIRLVDSGLSKEDFRTVRSLAECISKRKA